MGTTIQRGLTHKEDLGDLIGIFAPRVGGQYQYGRGNAYESRSC